MKSLNYTKQGANVERLDMSGKIVTDKQEIVNVLNDYYCSIASKLLENTNANESSQNSQYQNIAKYVSSKAPKNEFFSIPFMQTEFVQRYIEQLNVTKATGLDDISAKFLKLGGPALYESITNLCNLSIMTNTFPDKWKCAKVTPIPKKPNNIEPSNFRPISVLPVLSKIIEKHVHTHLYDFLTKYNLLSDRQFGFRPKHSCQTALTLMIEEWLQELQDGNTVGTLMIDFTKAFDLVDHNILLTKLELYKCNKNTVNWFRSYLKDRQQNVCISLTKSELQPIHKGVPQGSILGPLLFILYVNDIDLAITQ